MIPDGPLPHPAALATLHRSLARALDDNHVVYQRCGTEGGGADFWIRHISGRSLFIYFAAHLGRQSVTTADSGGDSPDSCPDRALNRERLRELLTFQAGLLPGQPRALLQRYAPVLAIFSSCDEAEVKPLLERLPDFPLVLAGRESLRPARLRDLVADHLGAPVAPDMLASFRRRFSPEAIVPTVLNPHSPADLTKAAGDECMLDYQQECALKLDLGLDEAAHQERGIPHLRLLNGVAGSGKSLIMLYRVRLLRQLYPKQRVLVLVHSKPVARDLQMRYQRISDGDDGPEWLTFYQWCRQFVPGYLDFANDKLEREVAADIVRVHLADTRLSPTMLLDEIHFYKDRLLFSLQDYLNAGRGGQGFRLSEGMRKRIFVAMRAFDQRLNSMLKASWHDLPRLAWERIDRGLVSLPQYAHILVDEAQFFAPLWFELLKRAVEPQRGHLWMAADPSQGFLQRRRSWLSAGIEVRGRTTRLHRSYRTTEAIMSAASDFVERRDIPQLCPPPEADSAVRTTPTGKPPELWSFSSEKQECEWLCVQVAELIESGVAPEQILVASAGDASVLQLGNVLNRRLGAAGAAIVHSGARIATQARGVKVCRLRSVSGLEARYVFLTSLQRLFELEEKPGLCADEHAHYLAEHTRQIYTGMTRAACGLKMSMVGEFPQSFGGISGVQRTKPVTDAVT